MTKLGTELWYTVSDVALIMNCCHDTARARMEEMPECINVGNQKRRQLMVPQSSLEDWLRNHRITQVKKMDELPRNSSGKMTRMDRRTGKLVAV